MNNIVNEDDFKYYMQDIERYYFGARYNYNELLNNEMVPFKFKTVITKYIKEDVLSEFRAQVEALKSFDVKIQDAMTKSPKVISPDALAAEAVRIIEQNEISVLIVVDKKNHPSGIIHIHELLKAGIA